MPVATRSIKLDHELPGKGLYLESCVDFDEAPTRKWVGELRDTLTPIAHHINMIFPT